MGVGDWIMATGQVKDMFAENPMPVAILGLDRKPQWSEVFEHNPKILRTKLRGVYQVLVNGPGARPYIAGKSPEKWQWKAFGPTPGEIHLLKPELDFGAHWGRGHILVEPNIKRQASPNKAWSFEKWQELVNRLPRGRRAIQCGPVGTRWLSNVTRAVTPTFRHVAAVMNSVEAVVTTEGGLMHAAAALNRPAIILWSEFIDPTITGYKTQVNIRHASRTCGMRVPCRTCAESMDAITVDEVENSLRSIL